MEPLFITMFVTCSVALAGYLAWVLYRRDLMAPQRQVHERFMERMERSPWPLVSAQLGLKSWCDEPEILLCRHRLEGQFQGRSVKVSCYDRKHAGLLGQPSALRISFHQKLPTDGVRLAEGLWVERVHGVPSLCFEGESLLGQGPRLGRRAVPLRQDGPWLQIEASAPPEQLQQTLERVLELYAELERASHPAWVQAAERHGLRLEWESSTRHPRLSGLLAGMGVRASVSEGRGLRVLLSSPKFRGARTPELPGASLQEDCLSLLLPPDREHELADLLDECVGIIA